MIVEIGNDLSIFVASTEVFLNLNIILLNLYRINLNQESFVSVESPNIYK